MKYKALIKAGIKTHKGILLGIFVLVMLVSVFLGTVLTSAQTGYAIFLLRLSVPDLVN